MSIGDTLLFYENLKATATKKSHKKLYSRFVKIFRNLKARNFDKTEIQKIASKIQILQLQSEGMEASFHRKKLSEFTKFLNKEFSLVTEGHYTSMGIIYGMLFGVSLGLPIGTAFGSYGTSMGLSMGIAMGMAIGVAFGAAKDAQAKKENRVLS